MRIKPKILAFLVLYFSMAGCEKEEEIKLPDPPLPKDYQVFVGTWKWSYTKSLIPSHIPVYDFKSPSSKQGSCTIEISITGDVIFKEGGNTQQFKVIEMEKSPLKLTLNDNVNSELIYNNSNAEIKSDGFPYGGQSGTRYSNYFYQGNKTCDSVQSYVGKYNCTHVRLDPMSSTYDTTQLILNISDHSTADYCMIKLDSINVFPKGIVVRPNGSLETFSPYYKFLEFHPDSFYIEDGAYSVSRGKPVTFGYWWGTKI